jgi:hypothetical protein
LNIEKERTLNTEKTFILEKHPTLNKLRKKKRRKNAFQHSRERFEIYLNRGNGLTRRNKFCNSFFHSFCCENKFIIVNNILFSIFLGESVFVYLITIKLFK